MKTTFFETYNAGWQHGLSADVSPAAASHKTFRQIVNAAWRAVLAFITHTGDEPHIWMSHTSQGESRWNAYDPITGRHLYAATEDEVLVWLEDRYNVQ